MFDDFDILRLKRAILILTAPRMTTVAANTAAQRAITGSTPHRSNYAMFENRAKKCNLLRTPHRNNDATF